MRTVGSSCTVSWKVKRRERLGGITCVILHGRDGVCKIASVYLHFNCYALDSFFFLYLFSPDKFIQVVTFLLCTRHVYSCTLSRDTDCSGWGFTWFFQSVLQNSRTVVVFHVLFHFTVHRHPIVRQCVLTYRQRR